MTIVVTGSVATDHLMRFGSRFSDQIVADQLENISLSFLADDLHVRRGGVAANICFGLSSLGRTPVLVASVGSDFDDYDRWLSAHGVDTSYVFRCEDLHTARFICTTDTEQNQIATFYPGAMARAASIDLVEVIRAVGDVQLVMVSPDAPDAMASHTRACRASDIPFAADPSQQIASLDGSALRELVDGAHYLFTNEYEAALLERKTGWHADELATRVRCWITTRSEAGVSIRRRGENPIDVPAVRAAVVADPTGVGDAFRAGFLAADAAGLGLERSAMAGAALATTVIETTGTQEYEVDPRRFAERLAEAYGTDAARDIISVLPIKRTTDHLEITR
jgi:adenosine kinase